MDERNGGIFGATIDKTEIMGRTFVTDHVGNVFSLPIGPEHNEAIAQGVPPPGFELVMVKGAVNPKYEHLLAGALILYQMVEAAKTLLEQHGEHLQNAGTPALMQVGTTFEQMAANLNLAQRQATEGLKAIVAQTQKYQK